MTTEAQPPPPIQWTPEQAQGIKTVGRDLLVSAAAGSGKTTILAERCVHLVCDAQDPCGIDELLVVTFTEAAAAEMKSRIGVALVKRIGQSDDPEMRRQLALLDHAHISTLHAFCARLLRQHFHLAQLDPNFRVLGAEEAALLRRETARALFDKRHDANNAEGFHRFIDLYGDGEEEALIRRVMSTHEMLCSLVDPQGWLMKQRKQLDQAAKLSLEHSDLGRDLLKQIKCGFDAFRQRARQARTLIVSLKTFPNYVRVIDEWIKLIDLWQYTFDREGIDGLGEAVRNHDFGRLPAYKAIPNKDLAKSVMDTLRDSIKEGEWRSLLNFTTADWQAGMVKMLPEAQTFLSLVEDFARDYRRLKDENRCVDFADLERKALAVLSERSEDGKPLPSNVARACQRRFKHVLVDEYQDINQVQDAILSLVSHSAMRRAQRGEASNLFCVGDVKQSIYRFRLAEPQQFLNRQVELRGDGDGKDGQRSGVIDLQANFRSRKPLLEAINGVFERLMTSEAADITYDDSHRLIGHRDYPEAAGCFAGAPIELHLLPGKTTAPAAGEAKAADNCDDQELDRAEREAILVTRRIRQMMGLEATAPGARTSRACVMESTAGGGMRPRPIRYGDIVVLLRSMRFKSEQFSRILADADIPVHAGSVGGYFDSLEIRDMLALLSLLNNQRQDVPMAAVLRSPFGKLPEAEQSLARIRIAYRSDEQEVPFHEAVVRYASEQRDELAARLRDFLSELQNWRQIGRRRTPDELLTTIYQESGYLAFVAGLVGGEQRVANLLDLHERAAAFARFARPELGRFLQFIESLRDEEELAMPAVATEADDVVRIMSVHRAKGLEFPVVIVPDLGKTINERDCQGQILLDRQQGLGLSVVDDERKIRYPSLASTLVRARIRQQLMAEELRVLYVAMTRAKEHLILIGTVPEKAPETWHSTWHAHRGPLPADAILGTRTMLGWLGPVAAATADDDEPIFLTTQHPAEEVAAWTTPSRQQQTFSPVQLDRAALRPLDPAPPASDAARAAIERLNFHYPFEDFTHLPASQSVTGRAKHHEEPDRERDEPAEATSRNGNADRKRNDLAALGVDHPRFFTEDLKPKATEVGDVTHRVLEHLGFAHASSEAEVNRQIESMVERLILSAVEAQHVDREAIAWFLSTELGQQMAQLGAGVRREIPVNFPMPSAENGDSGEKLDRVMIRGRLDVLLLTPGGCIIVDYKTDRVRGEALKQRAAEYAGQMRYYKQAIETITGLDVLSIYLVFLDARQIEAV